MTSSCGALIFLYFFEGDVDEICLTCCLQPRRFPNARGRSQCHFSTLHYERIICLHVSWMNEWIFMREYEYAWIAICKDHQVIREIMCWLLMVIKHLYFHRFWQSTIEAKSIKANYMIVWTVLDMIWNENWHHNIIYWAVGCILKVFLKIYNLLRPSVFWKIACIRF